MRPYEAMVILDPTLSEEDTKAAVAKVAGMVKSVGKGKVTKTEEWGKRKLAYEIKRRSEGYYVIYDFDGDPMGVADLEQALKISDPVLRFLVVRLQDKEA